MSSLDSIRFGLEIAGIMALALLGGFIAYWLKSSRDHDRLD